MWGARVASCDHASGSHSVEVARRPLEGTGFRSDTPRQDLPPAARIPVWGAGIGWRILRVSCLCRSTGLRRKSVGIVNEAFKGYRNLAHHRL